MMSRFLKLSVVPALFFLLINYCARIPTDPPLPTISVFSPDADSVWVAGATYSVRWDFSETSGDSVKILLCSGPDSTTVIAAAAANNGVYSWKVPYRIAGGDRYYITVGSTASDTVSGRSGYFTIVNYSDDYEPDETAALATLIDTAGPAQRHTLPYHDTDWFKFEAAAGKTYCIETHGSSDTYLQLCGPDAVSPLTSDNNSGPGNNALVLWTSNLSGTCFFKITGRAVAAATPYSVDLRAGSGILAITNPDSGYATAGGNTVSVEWQHSANSGNSVSLLIYRNDTLVDGMGVPNIGNRDWIVPYTLATSSHYHIKIVSNNDTSINTVSKAFTITNVPTTLTITTPSAASRWNTGFTSTIYWTYSGYPSTYVRLSLYDSTGLSPVTDIASGTLTTNRHFSWTIPVDLATGRYRIKIATTTGPEITAYSDSFTITYVPQSISITTPGAQDTWNAGTSHAIVWTSTGPIGSSVTMGLFSDTGYVRNISTSVAIGSSFYWSLPVTLAGGNRYRIKIASNDFPSVYGFSDYFTIVPVPDRVTILQPTASSSWNTGSRYAISWSYSGSPGPYIKLDLYDSSAFVQTITSTAPIADGIYTWLLPSSLHTSTRYQIRIAGAAADTVCDTSGFFSVTNMAPIITVTAPLSPATWTAGSSYFISWRSGGVVPGSFVSIYLYDGAAKVATIASDISRSVGNYSWTVPATSEGGGNFRIQVVCTSDTTVYGYSGTFTIAPQPNRLDITQPQAGTTWTAGYYYTIYWSYSGPDVPGTYARLDLYDSSAAVEPITSNVYATNHSFSWLVLSSLLPGDRYRIRIASATLDTVYGFSDYFTITNPALVNDAYEPDSAYNLATAIAKGGAVQNHTLSSESDQDWYKFDAVSGTTYTIETHGTLDTYLYLFSTDGESVLTFDDDGGSAYPNARISWTSTATGTYYFRVTSEIGDVGSYTVNVQ